MPTKQEVITCECSSPHAGFVSDSIFEKLDVLFTAGHLSPSVLTSTNGWFETLQKEGFISVVSSKQLKLKPHTVKLRLNDFGNTGSFWLRFYIEIGYFAPQQNAAWLILENRVKRTSPSAWYLCVTRFFWSFFFLPSIFTLINVCFSLSLGQVPDVWVM